MKNKIAMWIAWHTPRRLVYWCAVRLHAHATQGPYECQVVPHLTALDALKRWERDDLDLTREDIGATSLDGLESGWGLIANAWDWVKNPEWTEAAERWRDEVWHPSLAKLQEDAEEVVLPGETG